MNDTRSTNRRGLVRPRLAVVLCLLLVVSLVPMWAYAAAPFVRGTWSNAETSYLNSAVITLATTGTPTATYFKLDGGAATEGKSLTTGVYGAHTLDFWSVGGPGTEPTTTVKFFVDEDVAPVLACDAKDTYVLSASITCTATDNFNGSGLDFMCYRVDGKNYVQVSSTAAATAARLFFARLASVGGQVAQRIAVDPNVPPTHGTAGYGTDCGMCHDIISGGGTGGGDGGGDTGTTTPTGMKKSIAVTGLGTHKVEFWAQDVARNVSTHFTKTFTITKAPTTLSLVRSKASVDRYRSLKLSGVLTGGVPAGGKVVLKVKSPGASTYRTLTTRTTLADGSWSYTLKPSKHGRYYFKASYAGDGSYLAATCVPPYVSVYVK